MSVKKISKGLILLIILWLGQSLFSQSEPGLKELAAEADKLIGFEDQQLHISSIYNLETYQQIAQKEFSIQGAGQAMQLGTLRPIRDQYNWSFSDNIVKLAEDSNRKIHASYLTWLSAFPRWLNFTNQREPLLEVALDHIDTVLTRYKGRILGWDIAREIFNENGSLRGNLWRNIIGPDYMDFFYQQARESDPDAILLYNDYNIAEIGLKSNGVYRMVKSMVERGIPIDGIGFEMHLTEDGIDYESFARNMGRFADLGLEIWITEMDVRIPYNAGAEGLENQANIYRQVLTKVMAEPACTVFQVCGITDRYSWVPSTFPGTGKPLLWDDEYNPKPAYFAVRDVLAHGAIEPTPSPLPPDLEFQFIPDVINCETFSTVQLNLALTSREATLGAYELTIFYNSPYLEPDSEKGIFTAVREGFLSEATMNSNGAIMMTGFDIHGIGPGTEQDFLKINFKTTERSGVTEVSAAVNNLSDQDENPLTGSTGYASLLIKYVEQCPIAGDGNKDGKLNIVDALLAAQIYVGIAVQNVTEPCLDINSDGKVTIVDALLIAQAYVNRSSA